MAYPIKFLLLQKSELMYEVAIRGEDPSDKVESLRKQVTKLTQLYPPDDILDSVYSFEDDVKGLQETLAKIKTNIESLNINYVESLLNRTRSLLNHVFYRLQRIEKPNLSEQKNIISSVLKTYEKCFSAFSLLSQKTVSEPNTMQDTAASNEDIVASKLDQSDLKISVTCDRGVSNDLKQLKYDGKTCVRSFIQRLEEFRESKNISESKMLASAVDILTGDALHWYRSVKSKIHDWNTLVSRLKADFDILDYDYRMSSEIRDRTQGDGESITIYLSIMEGMFSRLSNPLSDEDKLEIILHNIRPCYSTIIAASPSLKSVDDLRVICRNYEHIKVRSDNYREPPSVSSKTLAPEFAYQSQHKKYNNTQSKQYFNKSKPFQSFKPESSPVFEVQAAETAAVSKPEKYCQRCRVNTHSMKECTAERTIFCFKCGMKDVRLPECPKCNGSKN
ncbi:uncharacterized protein LOC119691335 [Plutella xylostella]|uniref:uncharacterized protein LOC119691335 n=1 Tax=Plutella xylostella TaxID=51655 RepID=UPI002033181F|nr:uncharacterized protein LOC119691335 [Plutella xylostella]